MQSPLLSTYKPAPEFLNFSQIADNFLSFDEAFDTESLRSFFRKQRQVDSYGCLDVCRKHAKSIDENMLEESSLCSPDDRETQASPLVRYMSKYSANSLSDSPFAVNLNRLFSEDLDSNSMTSPTSLFELSRDPQEVPQIQSLDNIAPKQNFVELKKVTEMKGNMRMTMSFGSITLEEPKHVQSQVLTEHIKVMEDEDTIRLMKLVRMKKVFKIQRDLKPKTPVKNKINANKTKGKASPPTQPQTNPVLSTATPVTTAQPVQNTNPMNNVNAAVMNIVQAMKQQGFNHQQIMNHLMMMQGRGTSSPSQMMNFNGMGQTSPSQMK